MSCKMFRIFLAVVLLNGILCGPLPSPSTEASRDEKFVSVEPSLSPTDILQKLEPSENVPVSEDGEKLETQETYYPVGGFWWGVRPWGGWGGYRPWHGHHWGGWGGGYKPWYRPHWGGHWGGHWGAGR